jgi:signal transduction histidine kinase
MQFNMALFNKINKRYLFIYVGLPILLLTSIFFYNTYTRDKGQTQTFPVITIDSLISRADSYLAYSPELAEKEANKALQLAQLSNQPEHIIRAWLILGKVYTIKGYGDKALSLYEKTEMYARQNAALNELCEVTLRIGEIKYKHGDYKESLHYFRYADSIALKHNLKEIRCNALYYIGKYNQATGNFQQSNLLYHQALTLAQRLHNKKLLTLILPSLGKYYISDGKLYLALQCYLEVLKISEELNDHLLNAEICNHLGGMYLQMNQYEKALAYHKKALAYRNEMNNPEGLAKSYNNIGKSYFELKKTDTAMIYFKRSLVLCEMVDYKKGLIKAEINIGHVYILQHKTELAKEFLLPAFNLSDKIGYDAGIAEASLALGDLYKNKQQNDTAIYYYVLCLNKLSKTNYDELLRNTYQGLFACYNRKNDYKNALYYHMALLETEKKLLNLENNRQLAMLNISFDTERKEKDYRGLLKDNELKASLLKSKNTVIWLTIVVLGFTILLCLYMYNRFYIKKKANKLLEELNYTITKQNIEFEKLNKELDLVNKEKDKLFSIISHELRNPLYWLQNLAEVLSRKYHSMSPDKIRKTLSSLDESAKNVYHLMDNLLYWSRSKLNRIHPRKSNHNLYDLIHETTQMYSTFLQQKEILLENNIPKNIEIYADADLFNCVIRNLISNAIKYTPNEGFIRFDYNLADGFATVTIIDSGKGISTDDLQHIFSFDNSLSMPGLMQEKGSGLGLKLCKDFVEINDGTIWADCNLTEGTRFFFTVPLHRSEYNKKEELDRIESMS